MTGELLAAGRGMTGVPSCALSVDGRTILAGGGGTLWLWDGATGTALAALRGQTGSVLSVRFSHDGRLAVAGDSLGQVLTLSIENLG